MIACVAGENNPFILYLTLGLFNILLIVWMIIVRPFTFVLTTFRLVLTELFLLGMCGVMAYYNYQAKYKVDYVEDYEYYMLVLAVIVLGVQFLMLILEHVGAWRVEIWNKIEPCLVRWRLKEPRNLI